MVQYKHIGGYYYKEYANGDKKRVLKSEYMKKVGGTTSDMNNTNSIRPYIIILKANHSEFVKNYYSLYSDDKLKDVTNRYNAFQSSFLKIYDTNDKNMHTLHPYIEHNTTYICNTIRKIKRYYLTKDNNVSAIYFADKGSRRFGNASIYDIDDFVIILRNGSYELWKYNTRVKPETFHLLRANIEPDYMIKINESKNNYGAITEALTQHSVYWNITNIVFTSKTSFNNVIKEFDTNIDNGEKYICITGGFCGKHNRSEAFFSPKFEEIAYNLGEALATKWTELNCKGIVSASLAGEHDIESWDYHVSKGFYIKYKDLYKNQNPPIYHFMDINTYLLGGLNRWYIPYGTNYICEVDQDDFSNNLKEFVLTRLARNGITIFGGGGPTVGANLLRFNMIPNGGKQYTHTYGIQHVHGTSGGGGMTGQFIKTNTLNDTFNAVNNGYSKYFNEQLNLNMNNVNKAIYTRLITVLGNNSIPIYQILKKDNTPLVTTFEQTTNIFDANMCVDFIIRDNGIKSPEETTYGGKNVKKTRKQFIHKGEKYPVFEVQGGGSSKLFIRVNSRRKYLTK